MSNQTQPTYDELATMLRKLQDDWTNAGAITTSKNMIEVGAMLDRLKAGEREFMVIGYSCSSGQICAHPVTAKDGMHAFWVASETVEHEMDWVAAVPSTVEVEYPGESLVSSETVLSQPDVFNG